MVDAYDKVAARKVGAAEIYERLVHDLSLARACMPTARHERARVFRARAEAAACLSPHTDEDRESFTGATRVASA